MSKPQIGDTFIIQYQIVEEVETGEEFQGMLITNYRRDKFWAVPVRNPHGHKIMVLFDDDYDPFIQALKEFNLKPLDASEVRG